MNHPKTSVIIPTYNSAQYLPVAIDSVLMQTCDDYEIVVVDDGSTDDTSQIMAGYGKPVRYIYQENRGLSAARNTGIREARGEYLVFLDADDELLPSKLEIQSLYLDKTPSVGVVYSDGYLVKVTPNGSEVRQQFSKVGLLIQSLGTPSQSLPVLLVQNGFPVHAAMVRRAIIEEVNGFDEELSACEDWDLWYRIAQKYNFAYLDALVVKYRWIQKSMSRDRRRMKSATARLQEKMETSDVFSGLPGDVKSLAYFSWGVMDLEFVEPERALARFSRAIECNPRNVYAWSARFLTRTLGRWAVEFYHLKRHLFGARRLPGLNV